MSIRSSNMALKFKSLVGDFMTYAINGIAIRVIGILALPIITRVFTVQEYGAVDTIQSMIALLPSIIGLGYDIAIMKQLITEGKPEEQRNATFTLTVFLSLWGALIIGIGIIFSKQLSLLLFGTEEYSLSIVFALLSICSAMFFGLAQQLLRVEFRLKAYTVLSSTQALAQYGLIIIFIAFLHQGVLGYFIACVIVNFLWSLIAVFCTRRFFRGHFESHVLVSLLKLGVPVMISSLAYWVITSSDRILLTQLSSLTQTGYYSMAINVVAVLTLFVTTFSKAWTPRAFQAYADDEESYMPTTHAMHPHVAVLITSVALFNIILAKPIILIFSTEAYLAAAPIVVPLAFAGVFQCLSQFSCMGIYFKDRTRDIAIASWAAAVFNVVANVVLIPFFGAIAAGVITMTSYLFIYLFYHSRTCKYLNYKSSLMKPLSVALIGMVAGILMSFFDIDNIVLDCFARLAILGAFILVIVVLKLFEPKQLIDTVKSLKPASGESEETSPSD